MKRIRGLATVAMAIFPLLLVGGCSGGSSAVPVTTGPPARGTLLQNPPQLMQTIPAAAAVGLLDTIAAQELVAEPVAICDIAVYRIRYETVGGRGELTEASAALMVPLGSATQCNGSRPLLLYAHGTVADRRFDIAALQSAGDTEGALIAALFAAHGYVVVAPNYAGYDTSTLGYHPYLVADQQSKDMIDALTAARRALQIASLGTVSDSGKLFITGYSQGGYVAMATHRALQAAGSVVTASAPMSGPYSLNAFVDAVFMGEVNDSGTVSAAFLATAYQHAYGDIYTDPLQVFEPAYAPGIDSLLPGPHSRAELYTLGRLPVSALFSSTPPSAALAGMTPATTPAALAPTFAAGFGGGNLITNAYRLSYIDDAIAHPDGGWPSAAGGGASAGSALALRRALALNDLRTWVPRSPVLLCGGDGDPTVFWLNTDLMQQYWAVHPPGAGIVTVLDVDAATLAGDPYPRQRQAFSIAKTGIAALAILSGATDGGAHAVAAAYHAELVPPACLSAAASFFNGFP